MSPWAWYWKEPDDEAYRSEQPTRAAAIEDAERELETGTAYDLIEARLSEDKRHWESDVIPFCRVRNGEGRIVPERRP